MKSNMNILLFIVFIVFAACGSKKSATEKPESNESSQKDADPVVHLDSEQQQMAGIKIEIVKQQQYRETITLPGRVVFDERRVAHLTARVPGRVEKVYAFLGDRIKRDGLLATIYSPDYLSSQAELIQAEERMQFVAARHDSSELRTAQSIVESARRKLLVMGATEKDLREVVGTGIPRTLLEIRAPLDGTIIETGEIQGHFLETGATLFHLADISKVWVLADVTERDLPKMKPGLAAEIGVSAYPDIRFAGRLTTIFDMLDEVSRTVKVRIEVENPSGRLKPQMYCETYIIASGDSKAIIIPAGSVVKENDLAFVFVARNDTTFERREVSLGTVVDSLVEAKTGLKEGERIVTRGSFHLKSELLKEAFSEEE